LRESIAAISDEEMAVAVALFGREALLRRDAVDLAVVGNQNRECALLFAVAAVVPLKSIEDISHAFEEDVSKSS
jgi:hypothetical protein